MTISPPDTPSERKADTPREGERAQAYWDAVDLHHDGNAVSGADVEGALADRDATSDAAVGFDLLRGMAPVDPVEALVPGTMLGSFRIDGVIDHGGMGLVYRAECQRDRRQVAIKVLRPLHSNNPTSRLRFEREFEVMRKLDHPSIVSVRETGQFRDQRYLVMKLIAGRSLAKADPPAEDDATVRDWCARFATLARALHHAHAAGVVHRDVKPSNILVDHDGRLMLTDFGIAHAAESETLTTTAAVIGTPIYMAPEQAGAEGTVDARSDVYSLGATMYHWFTGRAPFDAKQHYAATVHAIHHERPAPVRDIKPSVPKPLARVIERAMAKAPRARHATAEALAEHLDCIARGEPFPKRRSARRERVLAGALLVTLTSVAIAAAWMIPAWQRRIAQTETESAYFENIARASALLAQGFPLRATRTLDACPAELRHFEWHYLDRRLRPWTQTLETNGKRASNAQYSADGSCLAVLTEDELRLFDTTEWQRRAAIPVASPSSSLAVSTDGALVAVGQANGCVRILRGSDGLELRQLQAHKGQVTRLGFAPDGTWLVTGGADRLARIWSLTTGEPLRTLDGHAQQICALAVSRDGSRVATGSWLGRAIVWRVQDGRPVSTLEAPHAPRFHGLAFSADDRLIASTHWGADLVGIWTADTGRAVTTLWCKGSWAHQPAFSHDGKRLVVAQEGIGIRSWHVADWRPKPIVAVPGAVTAGSAHAPLVIAPDAVHVVSLEHNAPVPDEGPLQHAAVAPDGKSVFSSRAAGPVRREWFDDRPPTRLELSGPRQLAVSPSGNVLFAGGTDGLTRTDLRRSTTKRLPAHGIEVQRIALSRDGSMIASSSKQQVCVTRSDSGDELMRLVGANAGAGVAFADDATRLIGASIEGVVRVWNIATGREESYIAAGSRVHSFAMDDQERRFVTAGWDGRIRIFDRRTLRLAHTMRAAGLVQGVAFTPDGSRLLTRDYHFGFDVWDPATGRRLLSHREPDLGQFNPGRFLARGPSGLRFFSAGRDFRLHAWDGRPRAHTED